MDEKFNELLRKLTSYTSDPDLAVIRKAHEFAAKAHEGQRRASGESYYSHCLAVADILTELKLDIVTVTAALLHDTIEDTGVSHAQLVHEFGAEIADMVEGVTKISSYHFTSPETAQAENWRKMLLAVTKDIRVILIKLADRLHNLRTIRYLPAEKQRAIANESLHFYAAFAQRLGVYRWKSEMEQLSFEVLHPDDYRRLYELWERQRDASDRSIERWKGLLEEQLHATGISFRLSARPKSLYGIYKKMERQHKDFTEIQDLIGLRLITDTVANCYALLGIITTQFEVVTGSFTDYITMPKMNMYQSLHVTVAAPGIAIAEIQIRTEEMHRRAEYGIAAHWRYKEKGDNAKVMGGHHEDIEEKLDWLKSVMEWQSELKDSKEFLDAFRTECQFEQVFVFTPKGKVITLPKNATPVDFAFAVHSEIGIACFGAKVNNKMVTLDYRLNSGEMCEILTRKNACPHEHWLKFAVTAQARAKIRKFLKEHSGSDQRRPMGGC